MRSVHRVGNRRTDEPIKYEYRPLQRTEYKVRWDPDRLWARTAAITRHARARPPCSKRPIACSACMALLSRRFVLVKLNENQSHTRHGLSIADSGIELSQPIHEAQRSSQETRIPGFRDHMAKYLCIHPECLRMGLANRDCFLTR